MTSAPTVTILPVEDKILVLPAEPITSTRSGILLPETLAQPSKRGTVLAVGRGRIDDRGQLVPVRVVPGQIVLYTEYAGTDVDIEGTTYVLISSRDLLGFLVATDLDVQMASEALGKRGGL